MKHANTSFILQMLFIFCCLTMLFAPSSADAKIVFIYNGSIYVMNDDGSGIRRLTDNQFWEWEPRWSPDGTQIAFERNLEKDRQKWQLFLMNADGTNQQQLIQTGGKSGFPAWSPDGKHLAFSSDQSGKLEIYVIELERSKVKQLTGIEKPHLATAPDWSPDGKKILYEKFISRGGGLNHKNIYVMSADGTNPKPFLPDPAANDPLVFRFYPHWSPDGQRILFHESTGAFGKEINRFIIQTIGGVRRQIDVIQEKIGGRWVGSGACWMDNGHAILFSAGLLNNPQKEHHDIYRYEIATRRLRRLTRNPSWDTNPDWIEGPLPVSPQGKLSTQWGEIKHARDSDSDKHRPPSRFSDLDLPSPLGL